MDSEPFRINEPLIVPASLDPDAVKIIRRLRRYGHEAYLVGGCVRDLSLGHIPKDFDVATSARPRQVKRLFRNSRIIGRRFKLVHVQFGNKIIEVSTFRRNPGEVDEADEVLEDTDTEQEDLLIRRDNVFGSAEEDAVRRDFTINGLFFDTEESVVLDFVGGADDLDRGVIRTIGDPMIRFQEDPVRILRAMRFAARLDFSIDDDTYDAMVDYREDLSKCAAPRVAEELLRLLSCGNSRRTWDLLDRTGVMDIVLPEIADFLEDNPEIDGWHGHVFEQLLRYFDVMDDMDRGRRVLSNSTLLTVLLVGPIMQNLLVRESGRDPGHAVDDVLKPFSSRMSISRREAFRIKQIIVAQSRFRSGTAARRRRRVRPLDMVRREYFKDALDFFYIESEALGLHEEELAKWSQRYYDHLRQSDPEAYKRALVEAPFGIPSKEAVDARRGDDESREELLRKEDRDEPKRRRKQKSRRRDGSRSEESSKDDEPRRDRRKSGAPRDEDQVEDVPEKARPTRASRTAGRGKKAKASQKPRSAARTGEKEAARSSGKTVSRGTGSRDASRKGRGRGANDAGYRLEFDELRSGPLKPEETRSAQVDDDPAQDVDDAVVEVRWDDPLPSVGDPGPISVIETGIDQTEKKGNRKRKKKRDAASRELSKEVHDQPALQALKMMGGDPRGHQTAKPLKKRRREDVKEPVKKEIPFDPVADFESIESIYNW